MVHACFLSFLKSFSYKSQQISWQDWNKRGTYCLSINLFMHNLLKLNIKASIYQKLSELGTLFQDCSALPCSCKSSKHFVFIILSCSSSSEQSIVHPLILHEIGLSIFCSEGSSSIQLFALEPSFIKLFQVNIWRRKEFIYRCKNLH